MALTYFEQIIAACLNDHNLDFLKEKSCDSGGQWLSVKDIDPLKC